MDTQEIRVYEFGSFHIDTAENVLLRADEIVQLTPKVFETLLALVEKQGHVVSKEELIERVWPDTVVEEANLAKNIWAIRRILETDGLPQPCIETIPKRGYRFIAPVTAIAKAGSDAEKKLPVGLDKDEPSADLPRIISERHWIRNRWTALAALAVLVLGALTVALYRPFSSIGSTRSASIKSLAVLPLKNVSGDPTQEYFAEGMTEELIQKLAEIKSLSVISRTSAFRYKGSDKALPQIARELGNVDAVIEGSVQRSDSKIRVTVQLIDAASDTHLWAQTFEREPSDILFLESDIAAAVAQKIRAQITTDERKRFASAVSIDPDAYNELLLGNQKLSLGTPGGFKEAIEHFERATKIAPDYAEAYARLSDAWRNSGVFGDNSLADVEIPARAAALKAVKLDPDIAGGHASLSIIKQICDRDWASAEDEIKLAIEIEPGNPRNHQAYSYLLTETGRHQEALEQLQRALQLDPVSSNIESTYGVALHFARNYDEAILHLNRSIELNPQYITYSRLGATYVDMGKYEEAINAFKKGAELQPNGRQRSGIAVAYALSGNRNEAERVLKESMFVPFDAARVYLAFGDIDKAFAILEEAIARPDAKILYLKEAPGFESLHSDPRWASLMKRLNFPAE